MKKLRLTVAFCMIAFVATSCENLGLLGQGGVKGSVAKTEIMSQIQSSQFLYSLLASSKFGGFSAALMSSIVLQFTVDGMIVPGLAGVSDGKHYSRKSVNACKDSINQMNLILGAIYPTGSGAGVTVAMGSSGFSIPSASLIGGLQCDLKTTPALLQIGDGDTGSVIQLGPLGL